MLTVFVFIVILGILIFVHELGHFVVARRNGIKAEEFGFGFPPRILGFQKIGQKWRFIWGKKDTDEEWENKNNESEGTIFSLNWFPLGGFVKIKGENGEGANEPDSFAAKSAWTRIKVLGAGVTMNFVLAWLVISLALTIGAPQEMENARGDAKDLKIQISEVRSESVAEKMGFKVGDEVLQCLSPDPVCLKKFAEVDQVIAFIGGNSGREIVLKVKRGNEILNLQGFPQFNEEIGRGQIGVGLVRTAIVSYPWYQALVEGLIVTWRMIEMVFVTFYTVVSSLLIGKKVAVEVAGPVGIVYFTKQVTELGFVYILQFVAILSVNLGIINILPFPALDGGRILFILIEKVKGSPVSAKVEQVIHTIGFALLIGLMIFVTFKDIIRFDVWEKLTNIF